MKMGRQLALFSAVVFFACFSAAAQSEQRQKVIYEPFGKEFVDIRFEESTHSLSNSERQKLLEFGKRVTKWTLLPMHECDFDVFVIEGMRHSESGEALVRLDELFAKRVRQIREILTPIGIPEGAGYAIKPSENKTTGIEIDNVAISVRYSIHDEDEKIDPTHIRCKFGQFR